LGWKYALSGENDLGGRTGSVTGVKSYQLDLGASVLDLHTSLEPQMLLHKVSQCICDSYFLQPFIGSDN
jgi:hypothetical protein